MEHNGHPIEERVLLPASYVATIAFLKKDAVQVTASSRNIAPLPG